MVAFAGAVSVAGYAVSRRRLVPAASPRVEAPSSAGTRADVSAGRRAEPQLLAIPHFGRLPLWARGLVLLAVLAALAGVGYYAYGHYPDASPPRGSELEARIAAVFGRPVGGHDGSVVGDYLVERFYALSPETGERYVADILKGRIQAVQENRVDGVQSSYTFLLDQQNLRRDQNLYAAFVAAVARPEGPVRYLGLRAAAGLRDAVLVNYSGFLPEAHLEFETDGGRGPYSFLLEKGLRAPPQLIGVQGYNYLFSSSEHYGFFPSEFGLRASFVSELIVVDATSRQQHRTFLRLLEQYPQPLGR